MRIFCSVINDRTLQSQGWLLSKSSWRVWAPSTPPSPCFALYTSSMSLCIYPLIWAYVFVIFLGEPVWWEPVFGIVVVVAVTLAQRSQLPVSTHTHTERERDCVYIVAFIFGLLFKWAPASSCLCLCLCCYCYCSNSNFMYGPRGVGVAVDVVWRSEEAAAAHKTTTMQCKEASQWKYFASIFELRLARSFIPSLTHSVICCCCAQFWAALTRSISLTALHSLSCSCVLSLEVGCACHLFSFVFLLLLHVVSVCVRVCDNAGHTYCYPSLSPTTYSLWKLNLNWVNKC